MINEQATAKQIQFAKKLGIPDPEQFNKQTLRLLIDNAVAKQDKKDKDKNPDQSKPAFKKSFDNKSYYVAYAKDLMVALLMSNQEGEIKDLMQIAIECISSAREQL